MTTIFSADDLVTYIDNHGDLYRKQTVPIYKNLMAKRARGEYDGGRAVDAFLYLTESGAKEWARAARVDRRWHAMFPIELRREAARDLARSFEAEADLGNYDHLLPKKYQGQAAARKRAAMAVPAGGYDPGHVGLPTGAGASRTRGSRMGGKKPAELDREIDAALGAPRSARRGRSARGSR